MTKITFHDFSKKLQHLGSFEFVEEVTVLFGYADAELSSVDNMMDAILRTSELVSYALGLVLPFANITIKDATMHEDTVMTVTGGDKFEHHQALCALKSIVSHAMMEAFVEDCDREKEAANNAVVETTAVATSGALEDVRAAMAEQALHYTNSISYIRGDGTSVSIRELKQDVDYAGDIEFQAKHNGPCTAREWVTFYSKHRPTDAGLKQMAGRVLNAHHRAKKAQNAAVQEIKAAITPAALPEGPADDFSDAQKLAYEFSDFGNLKSVAIGNMPNRQMERRAMTAKSDEVSYCEINRIVTGFADVARDKGNGTVEDYTKIVVPTCLIKRVLDLQSKYNEDHGVAEFDNIDIDMGIGAEDALKTINSKGYKFFDWDKIEREGIQKTIILITWSDLMEYNENPNGEERHVGKKGHVRIGGAEEKYVTRARNFMELMFEIIDALMPQLFNVFNTFEYRQLLIQKQVLPLSDFYNTCHNELSRFDFNIKNVSTDMFSEIYMDLLGRFASDAGKKGGEFFTPTHLVKNVWRFLDVKEYAVQLINGEKTSISIGDPASGSNTFLTYGYELIVEECKKIQDKEIDKNVFSFWGQELKAFQYCLGVTNMIFHNTIGNYNIGINVSDQNANVITSYHNGIGKQRGKLDIVVANPPYGTKDYGIEYAEKTEFSDERWKYGVPKKQEGEYAFLMTILDLLNKNGKACIVMPLGTLFRDSGREFRKHLLQDDVVEGLISLPSNMFQTTAIPVVIWILNINKRQSDKGKVFMINASKDFEKVGKFNEWQPERSVESYLSRTGEINYSGYIDFENIERNEFNLSVHRYFSKEKEKEIVDIVTLGQEINELEGSLSRKRIAMSSLMAQIFALETSDV